MLVLFETPAGYALFKVLDEGKLSQTDDIQKYFEDGASAAQTVKLEAFSKFEDTTEALDAAASLLENTVNKNLKKFLKKNIVKAKLDDTLAVADAKLGKTISKKLEIKCVNNQNTMELFRGIRKHLQALLADAQDGDYKSMVLGLSHSLCRYKLKFSPDKVDTMVIQAIALLDELDKELNTYSMRVREWYGWHFPEMSKIIQEHSKYAKVILKMGIRSNASDFDLSDILEEEIEEQLKEAAEISMGTEISKEDISNIQILCQQVISITEYRQSLFEYLKNRMNAIAPNLSVMVGELVGARLIAHAGSLMNLAKQPASTVQLLGAEKALFRALKARHATPKYGLIYHASLVGSSSTKNKGKISRVLAAKTALATRVDALGEDDGVTLGYSIREHVERRVAELEGRPMGSSVSVEKQLRKHEFSSSPEKYSTAADESMQLETPSAVPEKKKRKAEDAPEGEVKKEKKSKKEKKDKKDKKDKKKKSQ